MLWSEHKKGCKNYILHPKKLFFAEGCGDRGTVRYGALFFYSLGMAAYSTQHILVRAFYAMRNSRTPAKVALYMVGLNFGMNLALVSALEERGLALATAVCAIIQVIWLAIRLARKIPQIEWRAIGAGIARMVVATAIMAGALSAVAFPSFGGRLAVDSVVRLAALVLTGVGTFAVAAWLLQIKELRVVFDRKRTLPARAESEAE